MISPVGDAALYLYVLVEHKSQPEHWTTFQLLRYMLAVWSDVLRREGPEAQRLPPILPVVFHQGAREWNSPRTFEALIESAGGEVPGESPAVHIPRHIFIAEAARRRYHDSEEDLMTYAEELMTRGREEGRVTDKQDVLIRQLTLKFGLTDAERQRIRGADDTVALDAALDELVVAERKEAVLGKLR